MTPRGEPISRESKIMPFTVPAIQWPTPASRVSGAACAISDPRQRHCRIEQNQRGDA
jgi:hypothetical protein